MFLVIFRNALTEVFGWMWLAHVQVDNFANWDAPSEWMRTSEDFRQNPIGVFFDPDRRSCRLPSRCDVRAAAKGHLRENISPFEAANTHLPPGWKPPGSEE